MESNKHDFITQIAIERNPEIAEILKVLKVLFHEIILKENT